VNAEINPLNAELNPICHLLALLGAHHIFHFSGLRVNTSIYAVTVSYPLCFVIFYNFVTESCVIHYSECHEGSPCVSIGQWKRSLAHYWPRHWLWWVISFTTWPLYHWERTPSTQQIGDCMGPWAGVDRFQGSRWDRRILLKRWYGITILPCVKSQNCADISGFGRLSYKKEWLSCGKLSDKVWPFFKTVVETLRNPPPARSE